MYGYGSAKGLGRNVVTASWLAVFVLFGYRATFTIMLGPIAESLEEVFRKYPGYSLMMSIYAVTAFLVE